MVLITEKPSMIFDLNQIARGDLLWGKHRSWSKGKAGFVTAATKDQLIVQYYPGIGNVTNHFVIPVAEVAAGEWEIRWSEDMVQVQEYAKRVEDKPQETEGEESDGLGGTDL